MKNVSQKRFLRGVNGAFALLSQAEGTVPRASNLMLTDRGNLKTVEGSAIVVWERSAVQTVDRGAFLHIFWDKGSVSPATPGLIVFKLSTENQLSSPTITILTGQINGGGGLNPATTYNYRVSACDGAGGETLANAMVSGAPGGANNSFKLDWNPVVGATFYRVFTGPTGSETELARPTTNTYTDLTNTGVAPAPAFPPVNTSIKAFVFYVSDMQALRSYDLAGAFDKFFQPPAAPLLPFQVKNVAAYLFGVLDTLAFSGKVLIGTENPCGGVQNGAGPLPMLLRFGGKLIGAFGNGHPIIAGLGGTNAGGVGVGTAITNSFSAQYPNWQAAVSYLLNDLIQFNIAGTNYIFKAIQGGVSGGGAPGFSAVLGSTVTDNKIIWQNVGQVTTSPAPRGAAHIITYAGSLIALNTSPTSTSDGLDGPSAIRASDLNNPSSWNPLNAAHLDKDDGDQIMGAGTFTLSDTGIAPTNILVIFKTFKTFQVVGFFGSTNFAIQQAKTDMGCVAPRSIKFLSGFGLARLTHLGVAVFNGAQDKIISPDIHPWLYRTVAQASGETTDISPMDWGYAYLAKAALCSNPPMYMLAIPVQSFINPIDGSALNGKCPGLQRILCYDLVLKAWAIIDLPWPIMALDNPQVGSLLPGIMSGSYQDGVIRRMMSGDAGWDGVNVNWSVQSREIFGEGATQQIFIRKATSRGVASPVVVNAMTMLLQADGEDDPAGAQLVDGLMLGSAGSSVSKQYSAELDIFRLARNAHIVLAGSGSVEIESIDFETEPGEIGTPIIIA